MIEVAPGPEHVTNVNWVFVCEGEGCDEAEVCESGSFPEGWAFFTDCTTLCRECAAKSVSEVLD